MTRTVIIILFNIQNHVLSYPLRQVNYLILCYRNASYSNEQHDIEVDTARVAAEEEVAKSSEDALQLIASEFILKGS